MPKLNRRQRCFQVLRWAESLWPCGKPCQLFLPDYVVDWNGKVTNDSKSLFGVTYRDRSSFHIYVSMKNCQQTSQAVETLIHEYTHAYIWPPARVEFKRPEHGPVYWTAYGEIMDAFMDRGGAIHSKEFPYE